ncbi:MAG TPA: rod shape-determining protein MreC [Longimicrobiaceae bacterium]|nr:rod shape-determining protein MreC [Longimicrobiaceae bacterium]
MLVIPLKYREGLADGLRATVLRLPLALQRGSADRQGRFDDVARLRAERDSLASFLVGQAGMAAENRELRSLLGFKQRLAYSFVAAEATRMTGPGRDGTLQLSAGSADGVREGAPIVTAEGLVGMVRQVDDGAAVAIDWTHPDFRASVMTTDGATYGLAEPATGPNGEQVLVFTPQALHTVPKTGALIVTSGDGQMYPRGIPIGKVSGSGKDKTGLAQRAFYIRPMVSPTQAAHVLVLGQRTAAPSDQDLAAAWGVRLTGAPPADSLVTPAGTPVVPGGASATPAAGATPVPAERPKPAAPRPRGPRLLGRPITHPEPAVQAPPATTPTTPPPRRNEVRR